MKGGVAPKHSSMIKQRSNLERGTDVILHKERNPDDSMSMTSSKTYMEYVDFDPRESIVQK